MTGVESMIQTIEEKQPAQKAVDREKVGNIYNLKNNVKIA